MFTTRHAGRIGAAALVLAAVVSRAAEVAGPASAAGLARPAPVTIQLIRDPRQRAIFCGAEGTETSALYARTLLRDLKRLEATGRTTAQSLASIEAEACDRPGLPSSAVRGSRLGPDATPRR